MKTDFLIIIELIPYTAVNTCPARDRRNRILVRMTFIRFQNNPYLIILFIIGIHIPIKLQL